MKKPSEISITILLLLSTAFLCPQDAGAWQPFGLKWGDNRATMNVYLNVNDPADQGGLTDPWNDLAEDALATWIDVEIPGSRFEFFLNNNNKDECDRFTELGTSNAVEWVSDSRCGGVFGGGAIAITFKRDNPITGRVNSADVLFRRDFLGGWTSADPGFTLAGPINFNTVAIHEFGHVLGLGHEDSILAVLNSIYHPNPHRLHADDRLGVRSRYPGPGGETDIGPSNWAKKTSGRAPATLVASPTHATAGKAVTMEWTQENFGTTDASFNIGFFLSTDNSISTSDTLLGRNLQSFVVRGFAVTQQKDITIPAETPAGTYFLGLCLDDDNALAETREDNNCLAQPRSIIIAGVEVVNHLISLASVTTSEDPTPVLGGPAGTFTIRATFTNNSATTILNPVFEVIELSGGNLLLNADGGPAGVGARLAPSVGPDGILSPSESFSVEFLIGLQARQRFSFLVNILGVPSS